MNILEKLVEKALNKSAVLVKTAETLILLANEVKKQGGTITSVIALVQTHHSIIQELYDRQELMFKAVKEGSIDTKLNNSGVVKNKDTKPN